MDSVVVIVNGLTKSTLRAAVAEVVATAKNCDYFPSLEMVQYGAANKVWAKDVLHVTDQAVGEITERSITEYLVPSN